MLLQQSFYNTSTMKLVIVSLFLYLSVFQTIIVESGIILDTFKSGVDTTKQTFKCGVHRFGGLVTQGKIVPCENKKPTENTNEIDSSPKGEGTTNVDVVSWEKTTEKLKAVAETAGVTKSVDVVSEKTTEKAAVTVPGGRRVITVGANCPEGYRGDGKGNCREEY